MQLPAPSLHFMRFVRFAYYVAARLGRAGHADWSAEARQVGDDVRAAGRVYGRVVENYGRKRAERFFPRTRRDEPEEGGGGGDTPVPA